MKSRLIIIFSFVLCLWSLPAYAARSFSVTQTPSPAEFPMGTTQSLTVTIANTNTGLNAGERIYEVRLRINTGTLFTATTAAPAGWTRSAFSTTSVTFTANSWSSAIAVGSPVSFTLVMALRTTTADVTETLRDARAAYTTTTTGPPFTRLSRVTVNNPASWRLKALSASFQITDLSGNPITDLSSGSSFRLIMTVTNRSTATLTSIVTSPNPPTANRTGTVTLGGPVTTYSPNPLTLAPGASGTITFQYSTNSGDSGTVYFTAYARNNTGAATSSTINSITLAVGQFTAAITLVPPPITNCAYFGQNITIRMTLTNNYTYRILNVTPTLTTTYAGVTLVSGPTPPAPNGPVPARVGGTPGTFTFTWVYQVTGGNPDETFTFTGSATGTAETGGVRTTNTTTSPTIKRGGFSPTVSPAIVYASSTNVEITWTITNQGCDNIKQASISIPAGWTISSDLYSLIGQNNPPNPNNESIENIWSASGSNPVVFTAPASPPNYLLPLVTPVAEQGQFNIVFSEVPSATGVYTFNVTVTDDDGTVATKATTVTVSPLTSSPPVTKKTWKENY